MRGVRNYPNRISSAHIVRLSPTRASVSKEQSRLLNVTSENPVSLSAYIENYEKIHEKNSVMIS